MLNNAWPSLIWHLYDFYLRPGGGYFGAKKANEPVHVQYSYDDRSISIVNAGPRLTAVTVHARVLALDSSVIFSRDFTSDAVADGVVRTLTLPAAVATSTTYFLDLRLTNEDGDTLSRNFYWLSAKPDVLDPAHATGTMTPVTSYADFTDLATMPAATVARAIRVERRGDAETAHVTLTNQTRRIAFFLRLQIRQGLKGDEVLPVLWEDNFVTLLPGERREITATYSHAALGGEPAALFVHGWNVQ
jgi:exo-1,4-beta-D-glucosaminidase